MNRSQAIISRIRSELPKKAFQPQPQRAWIVPPLLAVIVVGTWFVSYRHPPWYGSLLIGLAIGQAYACLAFLAHETLHGSVFKSRWKQNGIGYLGFALAGFSPTLWRIWHNQVHHGNTNVPDLDPDSYGTLTRFRKIPLAKFQFKTGIGSGHVASVFFFLYRFSYHAQTVLWMHSAHYKELFKNLNRRRAIFESVLLWCFWIALGFALGLRGAVYAILVPWMVVNSVLMSYITTNHFLRPLTQENEPLLHSMSVTSPRWVDWMHLNFSHHVEHHFFPAMNWKYTPLVRQKILAYAPEQFLAPPHWKALYWLYRTPRVYQDDTTLVNPYTGRTVD